MGKSTLDKMMFSHMRVAILLFIVSAQAQYAPGVPPPRGGDQEIRFHEPKGPSTPSPPQPGYRRSPASSSEPVEGRGPAPKQRKINHKDINVNLDREREHIKKQVKEDYMSGQDINNMDDTRLLMQYF